MDALLVSVPAFLIALGVIVFVHEAGHLLAAKAFGVRVVTFSLGFGKRLWGVRRGGTDYRISAIPLGGYVRMGGELPDETTGDPEEFLSKPRWQRIVVYLAGPLMNVVLSVLLIAIVFVRGIPIQALQEIPAVVGLVEEDSPAAAAGLIPGDRIVSVRGQPMALWKEVAFVFTTSPGKELPLVVEREGTTFETTLTPEVIPRYEVGDAGVYPRLRLQILDVFPDTPAEAAGFREGDELRSVDGRFLSDLGQFIEHIEGHGGQEVTVEIRREGTTLEIPVVPAIEEGKGRIGVALGTYRRLPVGEAITESVRYNIEIVDKSIELLGKLFQNEIAPKSALSGPIEIAAWSGRAARRGLTDLLYTMGFLSISIGFMNLLPIPVLDGGHISILVVESLLRRDLSLVIKERITQVGFMMLMTLMAMVIFFDLAKNLPQLIPGS